MARYTTSHAQLLMSTHRYASYRLGLIDPAALDPMLVIDDDGEPFKLLVPGPEYLPTSLLEDELFQNGALFGYFDDAGEDLIEGDIPLTPVSVANWVARAFDCEVRQGGTRAFTVGFLLGILSRLAETHRALALVGIAHFCFLLALVPPTPLPSLWPNLSDARHYHAQAVRVYRSGVERHKASGLDFADASIAALANFAHVETPYADGCLSLALHAQPPVVLGGQYAEESEVA